AALHRAIAASLVRSCHDLSEGGLAVALAEMAFAAGLGAQIDLAQVPQSDITDPHEAAVLLFSESNTRFLCEVPPEHAPAFVQVLSGIPLGKLGTVTDSADLQIMHGHHPIVVVGIDRLKAAWQAPLNWK